MAERRAGSLLDWVSQVPPDTLYHYTSLDALVKILKSGTLWASDIRYLNDASEYQLALDLIRARVDSLIALAGKEEIARLIYFRERLESVPVAAAYAVCFSAKRDDLSQWRGYTPEGKGVCIGFSSKSLRSRMAYPVPHTEESKKRMLAEGIPLLVPINYIATDDLQFDHLINKALSADEPLPGINFAQLVALSVAGTAAYYKHSSFNEEKEWRIILGTSLSEEGGHAIDFRQGKSTLIPYAEFGFKTEDFSYISEIVVGPTPNTKLSIEAVRRLLRTQGLDEVQVSQSDVPFRSW